MQVGRSIPADISMHWSYKDNVFDKIAYETTVYQKDIKGSAIEKCETIRKSKKQRHG